MSSAEPKPGASVVSPSAPEGAKPLVSASTGLSALSPPSGAFGQTSIGTLKAPKTQAPKTFEQSNTNKASVASDDHNPLTAKHSTGFDSTTPSFGGKPQATLFGGASQSAVSPGGVTAPSFPPVPSPTTSNDSQMSQQWSSAPSSSSQSFSASSDSQWQQHEPSTTSQTSSFDNSGNDWKSQYWEQQNTDGNDYQSSIDSGSNYWEGQTEEGTIPISGYASVGPSVWTPQGDFELSEWDWNFDREPLGPKKERNQPTRRKTLASSIGKTIRRVLSWRPRRRSSKPRTTSWSQSRQPTVPTSNTLMTVSDDTPFSSPRRPLPVTSPGDDPQTYPTKLAPPLKSSSSSSGKQPQPITSAARIRHDRTHQQIFQQIKKEQRQKQQRVMKERMLYWKRGNKGKSILTESNWFSSYYQVTQSPTLTR